MITRLIEAEAGVHGALGKQGVLFVVLNRMARGDKGGPTAVGVMNAPRQFEPVMNAGGNVRNLKRVSPEQIARTKQWIAEIQTGELTDPTDGGLYFLNRDVARTRGWTTSSGKRDTADFGADAEPLMVVGRAGEVHHFYNRYRGRAKEFVPPYRVDYVPPEVRQNQARERERGR